MEEDLVRGGPAGWTFASVSSGMPGLCSLLGFQNPDRQEPQRAFSFYLPMNFYKDITHMWVTFLACFWLLTLTSSPLLPSSSSPLLPSSLPQLALCKTKFFILFCFNNLICVVKWVISYILWNSYCSSYHQSFPDFALHLVNLERCSFIYFICMSILSAVLCVHRVHA